jgi:beta-lactam-binding protein with PASTA domain/tRNA A-37 threonylcarbamoyl transferase component Bud32
MTEHILSGRYVLNEVIGAGGMAVVYRAWDRAELREVAVKVLRSEYSADEEFIRRFNNEARAASKMFHPNIVGMYDVGQDGDARYIVMEYVKGRTLKDVIRQCGRIKPQRAVQMILRILAAVDHAHKSHIVHRDIKPQNILVDGEGTLKVADFGIARATNASTQTYTDGNNVLGSVHYFSPEQASGQLADEKSDLYSVGIVLYEMLTGQVPFDGETAISVALKHVQEPPKSVRLADPTISKALDEVILKALDKEASRRYQTAADMAGDLKRAIRSPRGGFIVSAAESQTRAERRKKRRQAAQKMRKYLLIAAAVLVAAAMIYYGQMLYNALFAQVRTPNTVMLDLENAVADLKDLGLTYTIEEQHHDEIGMGVVIAQYPEVGSALAPGGRVQLTVSLGKEKLMMPKLLELSRSEAVRIIEENDLVLGDVKLEISPADTGKVIDQSPAVNEWVKPGDVVSLRISGESAPVPELTGYTLDEARSILISAGFAVGDILEADSAEKQGTVIYQSIPAEIEALLSTPVDLTISRVTTVIYRATTSINIIVPSEGAMVHCTVEESTGEREVYSQTFEAGEHSVKLTLESEEPGVHAVRVYINEELAAEKDLIFE